MRLGADFYDPLWQDLLNQIPASGTIAASGGSLVTMVQRGGFNTYSVEAIGKPQMLDRDGPSGINANMTGGEHPEGWTAFPVSFVLAQTWNSTLAFQFGNAVANEARATGVSGWYAPGANIHRSPFSGRNFEYYSESPMFSGIMAGEVVRGSLAGGLRAYVKHWAVNDGEQNRYSLNTFLTEQSLREIYLKAFEIAVKDGGANAKMSGFNRLGTVWAGGNGALNNDILRDEWGFRGSIVTDFAQGYMSGPQGLRNGNDLWLTGAGNTINVPTVPMTTDMDFYVARKAAHNILFTMANSYYLSQISEVELGRIGEPPPLSFPWWIIWGMLPLNLIFFGLLLLMLYFAFKKELKAWRARRKGLAPAAAGADGGEIALDADAGHSGVMQTSADSAPQANASDPPDVNEP